MRVDSLVRHVVAAGRDGRALGQALEVGHGAVHGAGVDPLPRRVGRLGAIPVDDLVLVLARRFPPLPVQQEEVDDLLRVVAAGEEGGNEGSVGGSSSPNLRLVLNCSRQQLNTDTASRLPTHRKRF